MGLGHLTQVMKLSPSIIRNAYTCVVFMKSDGKEVVQKMLKGQLKPQYKFVWQRCTTGLCWCRDFNDACIVSATTLGSG